MQKITTEQSKEIYKHFRSLSAEDLSSFDASKDVDTEKFGDNDYSKVGESVRLFGRIAQTCTEQEFCDMMETGETPPIKLTEQEMEVIRGGIAPLVLYGACLLAGAAFAYFTR